MLYSALQSAVPKLRPELPLTTILHPSVFGRVLIEVCATANIYVRSSGLLKPGEMCLVLGCPGSGCTTFLKTIANERKDYARILGDVRYAGIDAHEMAKRYKGEVVYNEEGPFLGNDSDVVLLLTLA